MNDVNVPRADCPQCHVPAQLAGLPCGFCHFHIPMPAGTVTQSGTLKAGSLVSWKGMDVQLQTDGRLLLIPPMYDQDGPWEPGKWQVATCSGKPHKLNGHEAPGEDGVSPVKGCMCGFYSGRTREHQMALGYATYSLARPRVMVELQLAGKIYPADNGFRAQKVKPLRIHVPHELWEVARDLKLAYGAHGVEVKMGTTAILPKDAAPEWCPKCRSPWEHRGTVCKFCSYNHGG